MMNANHFLIKLTLSPSPYSNMSPFYFLSKMHGAIFEAAQFISGGLFTSEMMDEKNIAFGIIPSGLLLNLNQTLYLHRDVLIEGIKQLFPKGIGGNRRYGFRVVEVEEIKGKNSINMLNSKTLPNYKLTLHLITPTVIKHHNDIQDRPPWNAIVARSVDRLINLGYSLNKKELIDLSFSREGQEIVPYATTCFFEKERRSGRGAYQHHVMGMMGELIYTSETWITAPIVNEALKWGIGKTPSLGMGRGYITMES